MKLKLMEKKIGLESMTQHPYNNNYTSTKAAFGKKKKLGPQSGTKDSSVAKRAQTDESCLQREEFPCINISPLFAE